MKKCNLLLFDTVFLFLCLWAMWCADLCAVW